MAAEKEMVVVQSKLREYIRAKEMRASDEFVTEVSNHVYHLVDKAIARCKGNGRSTLREYDV